jgi:hypothetical protein
MVIDPNERELERFPDHVTDFLPFQQGVPLGFSSIFLNTLGLSVSNSGRCGPSFGLHESQLHVSTLDPETNSNLSLQAD